MFLERKTGFSPLLVGEGRGEVEIFID